MKHIITQAYNQGDWFNKDFALIRVTEAFKDKVRSAKDFINTAPEGIDTDGINIHLYSIPFANFYDSTLIDDLEDDELCPDIQQIVITAFEDFDSPVFIEDYIDILNPDNLSCIEGEVEAWGMHCIVSSSGVEFKANNKYGDGEEMWTDPIDFETILNF